MKKTGRIVYSLNVEDIQNVARETFKRELTEKEILLVEEAIGDHIDWFEAIEFAIQRRVKRKNKKNKFHALTSLQHPNAEKRTI